MKFITTTQFTAAKTIYDQKVEKAVIKQKKQFAKAFTKAMATRAKTYNNDIIKYDFDLVLTADTAFDFITNNSYLTENLAGYSSAGWYIVSAIMNYKIRTYSYCTSFMFTSAEEAAEYFAKLSLSYKIAKVATFNADTRQWETLDGLTTVKK